VETALIQARERLNLGDTLAAEALVREALRREGDNPAALALLDEINDRSGATRRQLTAAGIGLLLALAIVGFVAVRFRRRLSPYLRKLRLDEDGPRAAPPGRGPTRPHTPPHGAAEPRPPEPERPPPRGQAAGAARRKLVDSLIHETEALLQRLRQSDAFGQLTARLMELEAELSAIARRAADPSAELGPLHARIKAILAQARGLRPTPRPTPRPGAARQEPPRQEAPQQEAPQYEAPRGERMGQEQPRQEPPRQEQARQEQARQEQARQEQARPDGAQHEQARQEPPPRPPAGGDGAEPTHYEVLQLSPAASLEEIRVAYLKLLKQYHPDLHTASQFDWVRAESERMSRRISAAYQVLGNADSRARYDRELRKGKGSAR
jgi:DnaJ domain